ncbi:hypothetical protein IKF73_00255 [Candidatus Saccharibacteria bacterium]|nr:hypothetical protein [Candidatus Saccharibacteria bacterium]
MDSIIKEVKYLILINFLSIAQTKAFQMGSQQPKTTTLPKTTLMPAESELTEFINKPNEKQRKKR